MSFLTAKLPEKAKKIDDDEEDEHSPTSFITLRIWQLLKQKLKQVSSEDHRRFYQPTENGNYFFSWGGGGVKKFIVLKVAKVTTTFWT